MLIYLSTLRAKCLIKTALSLMVIFYDYNSFISLELLDIIIKKILGTSKLQNYLKYEQNNLLQLVQRSIPINGSTLNH